MKEENYKNYTKGELLQIAKEKQQLMFEAYDEGKLRLTIELGKEAADLFDLLQDWEECVFARCKVGGAYVRMGAAETETYVKETLDLAVKHLPEDSEVLGHAYFLLGNYYGQSQRDATTSLGYYQKARETFSLLTEETNPLEIEAISGIGFCHGIRGEYEKLLEYALLTLKLSEQISEKDTTHICTFMNNISVAYSELGDYHSYQMYIEEGLKILEEDKECDDLFEARYYYSVGSCYYTLYKYEKAIKYFTKALDIQRGYYGEMHHLVALSYVQVGMIHYAKREYKESMRFLEKALTIRKKQVSVNADIGTTFRHMAQNYFKMNELDKAIDYYYRALEAYGNEMGGDYRRCYTGLAECLMVKKDFTLALEMAQKAIQTQFLDFSIGEDVYAPIVLQKSINDSRFLSTLTFKAYVLVSMYREQEENRMYLEVAAQCYQVAHLLVKKLMMSYNTEHAKLNFYGKMTKTYKASVYVNCLLGEDCFAEAFHSAEKAKATLLLASVQDSQAKILTLIPSELLAQEKQLKIELTYLEKSIQKEEAKGKDKNEELLKRWQSEFFSFHQEYLQFLQQLETDYPDYYELKYDIKAVTPFELQSALEENQVVLNYFLGKYKLFIFVVTSDEFEVIDLQKPDNFEALIQEFMEALTQHQLAAYIEKGQQLHQLLIAPIQDFIVDDFGLEEDLKQVFIIPHEVLSYLPFEALVSQPLPMFTTVGKVMESSPTPVGFGDAWNGNSWSNLDYLIHHCEISYHYSATLLYRHLLQKENEEDFPNSFGGFAPIYDTAPSASQRMAISSNDKKKGIVHESAKAMQAWATRSDAIRSDGTWVSLPHSETEAKSIAQLFEKKGFDAETYLRENASKEGFATFAKKYKFILVAAHGLVNDEKTALSGLVFYSSVVENSPTPERFGDIWNGEERQMSPSFTNVGELSQTDSILSMEETHHLDLQADLVVLSSCESGIGTLHKGEGMMAVNRGFLAAGANNVISTLFKVYDKPSSLLTQYLFEGILEGKGYSEALRLAKLKLMQKENIDPKSWSGFVLIGG